MIRTHVRILKPLHSRVWRDDLATSLESSSARRQNLSNLLRRKGRSRVINESARITKAVRDEPVEPYSPSQAEPEKENTLTSLANLTKDSQQRNEPIVKWYHQLTPWSRRRKLADPENPDAFDESGIARQMKQMIDRLDAELKEMEDNPYGPILDKLPLKDREAMLEDMKQQNLHMERQRQEIREILPKLEIKWLLPVDQKSYLKDLNENIKESLLNARSYKVRRNLWRSYVRCKSFLPPFLHLVPEEAWIALFSAQAEAAAHDDPHWASHMIQLVEDMRAAGRTIRPDEKVIYIEALRFEDHLEEAINEWESLRSIVEHDQGLLARYELLGVRLFTSQGDLSTAEQLANKYLGSEKNDEAKIFIPMMDAWLERQDEIGMKRAWALYLTIKMSLGNRITLDDYDMICARFMNNGRLDMAVAVYKDMMLHSYEKHHDSLELYKRHNRDLDHLTWSTNKILDVNHLYLTSLTVVPEHFENKFFYSKWLKKLLGLGEADAAAAVVELMHERNVRPDAKHMNGILGAWYRSDSDADKDSAEKMAWSMVIQRLHYVQKRDTGDAAPVEAFIQEIHTMGLGRYRAVLPNGVIPSATVETYALLLQYYTKRSRSAHIRMVHEAFELGRIRPNSYWINPFLWKLFHELRLSDVWSMYIQRFDRTTPPDLDTFDCLWQSEKKALRNYSGFSHEAETFPPPRTILNHMLATRYQEPLPRALYDLILGCFIEARDPAGTIVTLHALRERFGLFPNAQSVKQVVRLVAEEIIKFADAPPVGSHRIRPRQLIKANSAAQALLKLVHDERSERLAAAGFDDLESLNPEVQRRERLAITVDFLKRTMESIMKVKDVDDVILEAAADMNMPDMEIVDYLHSENRA